MLARFGSAIRPVTRLGFAARGMSSGDWGSGAGKGGGSGGSIREAGGAMGRVEAAREEEFFRKLQGEQMKDLKKHLETEISFHEEQIKQHQAALARHKEAHEKADRGGQSGQQDQGSSSGSSRSQGSQQSSGSSSYGSGSGSRR